MQPTYIMAFRKRLYNRGYRDISIKHLKKDGVFIDQYRILARDPLSENFVERVCSSSYFQFAMR